MIEVVLYLETICTEAGPRTKMKEVVLYIGTSMEAGPQGEAALYIGTSIEAVPPGIGKRLHCT
jgi:hypothetical protein